MPEATGFSIVGERGENLMIEPAYYRAVKVGTLGEGGPEGHRRRMRGGWKRLMGGRREEDLCKTKIKIKKSGNTKCGYSSQSISNRNLLTYLSLDSEWTIFLAILFYNIKLIILLPI